MCPERPARAQNSLAYATRVRTIKNDVTKNEANKEILKLRKQIDYWKEQVRPLARRMVPAVCACCLSYGLAILCRDSPFLGGRRYACLPCSALGNLAMVLEQGLPIH